MIRTRIIGAAGALALLTAPAVAVAHGGGDGDHGGKRHHHAKQHKDREVTGRATATIQSFADGELTLALPSGKTFTAAVTDRTVIIARRAAAPTTTAPASTSVPATTAVAAGKRGGHDGDDDHGDRGAVGRVGTDRLVPGTKVAEAKLSLKGDQVVWKKITIVS